MLELDRIVGKAVGEKDRTCYVEEVAGDGTKLSSSVQLMPEEDGVRRLDQRSQKGPFHRQSDAGLGSSAKITGA